jgi:hypothetical protein
VLAAFTAQEVAERIRDERRASAHRRLLASEEAEAEADAVYDTVLRSSRGAQAAQTAAANARQRTAEYLLRQKVGQLQAARARTATGRRARPRPLAGSRGEHAGTADYAEFDLGPSPIPRGCTSDSSPAASRSTAATESPQSRPSARPAARTRIASARSHRPDHDRSHP